jgi:hypothetical protein
VTDELSQLNKLIQSFIVDMAYKRTTERTDITKLDLLAVD